MLIDIDDDALARAAAVLGTTTAAATVNRALQLVAESNRHQSGRGRFEALLDLIGERLAETDVRAAAWPSGH